MSKKKMFVLIALLFIGVCTLLGAIDYESKTRVPLEIVIRFQFETSKSEIDAFIRQYSKYGFKELSRKSGHVPWVTVGKYKYDDKLVYGRDFIKQIREDKIVAVANFYHSAIEEIINVGFHREMTEDELRKFALKFPQYELKFLRKSNDFTRNGARFSYNFDLIDYIHFPRHLMDEEEVRVAFYDFSETAQGF